MSALPIPFRLSAPERRREAERERAAEQKRKRDIDRAADLLDRLDARMNALSLSIAKLQRVKARMDARRERIEDRILGLMIEGRFARLDGYHRSFTTRSAPAALVVDDESKLPPEYFREKLVRACDKNAIKAALQRGEEIEGVSLRQKMVLKRE